MRFLLNAIYLLLIVAVSPWLIYAAVRHGKYREGFAQKFLGLVPRREGDAPCVWLHAVSVGEVNLLDTMIRTVQAKHPDLAMRRFRRRRRPGWQLLARSTPSIRCSTVRSISVGPCERR